MVTRYGNQDTDDVPDAKDSTPLHLMPQDHPMLEDDNDSSNEYCEETDTPPPLANLIDQLQQLEKQFSNLKLIPPSHTHRRTVTVNSQVTASHHDAPTSPPVSQEPVQKTMQVYTDTL